METFMTEENDFNEDIESLLELIINQRLVTENGGRNHVDLNDLESLDEEEYIRIIGDLEFELCLILRKKHLMKYPELRKIATKTILSKENSQHQSI
jgi:hypothetical protein